MSVYISELMVYLKASLPPSNIFREAPETRTQRCFRIHLFFWNCVIIDSLLLYLFQRNTRWIIMKHFYYSDTTANEAHCSKRVHADRYLHFIWMAKGKFNEHKIKFYIILYKQKS